MKRLTALLCAVLLIGVLCCSCNSETADKTAQKASEAVSDMKQNVKNDRETQNVPVTVVPTEAAETSDVIETLVDMAATEWNDMVENGEVEDGDGNVGDMENHDGDGNAAPEDE